MGDESCCMERDGEMRGVTSFGGRGGVSFDIGGGGNGEEDEGFIGALRGAWVDDTDGCDELEEDRED